MSTNNGGFKQFFFDKVMPLVYGLGASVVIVGAMFKIMHWKGADVMLIVGLSTEALIFAFSAFQPVHKDPQWERVYPQLADDYYDDGSSSEVATGTSVTKKLDEMLSDANIDQAVISKLGLGLNSLSESVSSMGTLTNAAVATSEYAENVKAASKAITDVNKSYAKTVEAVGAMANATNDARDYHAQVQNITKNLGALNAVYEMELQDANNHLRAMNKFYSNLSSAMENMSEASQQTQQFKDELNKLGKNLTALNNVYGNMLTAMRG
jgi:gliding motility-associated protein GldL